MKNIYAIILFLLFSTCLYAQKTWAQPGSTVEFKIIKFYPNPATVNITFDIQKPIEKGCTIQIYSILGNKVMTIPVTSNHVYANISELFRGVYVFHLRNAAGKIIESNKFQVNK